MQFSQKARAFISLLDELDEEVELEVLQMLLQRQGIKIKN